MFASFSTMLLNYILFMRLPTPGAALSSSTLGKTVTLLRHGCSYMNEYLGGADGGTFFGAPGFTDVFATTQAREKYHDAPLSPLGVRQVQRLDLDVNQLFDVVLVSPLRRALQTYDQGMHDPIASTTTSTVPSVIAVPAAAERLYLVSDLGRPVADLQNEFPYVDFQTYMDEKSKDCWWYQAQQQKSEWRPTGQGQRYACPGEPYEEFDERMAKLHSILVERSEERILLVCHHGVIENLLGGVDFGNCEYRTVPVEQLRQQQQERCAS